MRLLKRLFPMFIPLYLLVLAGCGGGASDASGTLTLAVAAPASTSQPGTATASYAPLNGKSPMGVDISFSTDHPELVALETGSRKVGSDGTAKVTFMTQTPQANTTVRITATTGGLSTFQTFTLTGDPAAPPPTTTTPSAAIPTQIQVLPTTPADGKLALKGTGTSARPENGFITFKVLDAVSAPVSGQVVDFVVSPTNNGGVTLTQSSMTSASDGTVTVGISAGSTQVTVLITATLRSNTALTATAQFAVTSGPPDQYFFSISAETLNSETLTVDNIAIPVTVSLSDANGNPPTATNVIFKTNSGTVDGSAITDSNGDVTVNWISGGTRPPSGILVIMARAVGEEHFVDANGNGLADPGEFTDTGDAFLDLNADSTYDVGEPYYPIINGSPYSAGDGLYNGMYQSATYAGAPKTKYIFKNIYMVMSGSQASISLDKDTVAFGTTVKGTLTIKDENNNPMPAGTTITVAVNPAATSACLSVSPSTFTVPNTSLTGQDKTQFAMNIMNKCSASTAGADGLTVTVVTKTGSTTTTPILMSY